MTPSHGVQCIKPVGARGGSLSLVGAASPPGTFRTSHQRVCTATGRVRVSRQPGQRSALLPAGVGVGGGEQVTAMPGDARIMQRERVGTIQVTALESAAFCLQMGCQGLRATQARMGGPLEATWASFLLPAFTSSPKGYGRRAAF